MSQKAYLFIAHGSRNQKANTQFETLVKDLRAKSKGLTIEGCFLEIAQPDIPSGLRSCVETGAENIFIIPLMFFSGRHVEEDIPRMIEDAKAEFPDIDFHFAPPLVKNNEFPSLLLKQIDEIGND